MTRSSGAPRQGGASSNGSADGPFRLSSRPSSTNPLMRTTSNTCRLRHHRPGAPEGGRRKGGTCRQGIGRSSGGLTSKIVAIVDALGYLVRFVILPGQAHDLAGVSAQLRDLGCGALIGGKAFDANWLIGEIEKSGAMAVIPPRRNRTETRHHDREMYKWRHQIENLFGKIKEFRAVATRYDKTDESFAAAIHLVSGVVAAT